MITNFRNILSGWLKRKHSPALVIGAVVMMMLLWQMASIFVWRPLQTRLGDLDSARDQLDSLQMIVSRGETAEAYCLRQAERSLSSDPAVVTHKYQQWLLERTRGIGEITVTPAAAVLEDSLGWRVPFQLEGDCELKELGDFLDEIERIPLLHRVTYLNVFRESRGRDRGGVHFEMSLEALAVSQANDREFCEPEENRGRESLGDFLAQRRPFVRGYTGPKPPPSRVVSVPKSETPTPPREVPHVDPLKTLRLIGSVQFDSKPQAWLMDSRTRREFQLASGQALVFGSFQGRIGAITADAIELQHSGKTLRWPMGQTLRRVLNSPR